MRRSGADAESISRNKEELENALNNAQITALVAAKNQGFINDRDLQIFLGEKPQKPNANLKGRGVAPGPGAPAERKPVWFGEKNRKEKNGVPILDFEIPKTPEEKLKRIEEVDQMRKDLARNIAIANGQAKRSGGIRGRGQSPQAAISKNLDYQALTRYSNQLKEAW